MSHKKAIKHKVKVVILGAGFGGLKTARRLKSLLRRNLIDLAIVDRHDYFLFTPLMPELIAGRLSSGQVALPLKNLLPRSASFYHQEIQAINLRKQTVRLAKETLTFDFLVIATGSKASRSLTEVGEKTGSFKNMDDVERLKTALFEALKLASKNPDKNQRKEILSWAIIGAGATGVELAAEINQELASQQQNFIGFNSYLHVGEFSVNLVSAGSEILSAFQPWLRGAAESYLKKSGVKIFFNSLATALSSRGLILSDGRELPAQQIIWTAGVKPQTPEFIDEIPAAADARLEVDDFLRLKNYSQIFCLGDSACPPATGRSLPLLAQVADQEAKITAKNLQATILNKPLKNFKYHQRGEMLSLGRNFALGEVFGWRLSGKIAKKAWYLLYAIKIPRFINKYRLAAKVLKF